jgi:hypothetical protein
MKTVKQMLSDYQQMKPDTRKVFLTKIASSIDTPLFIRVSVETMESEVARVSEKLGSVARG